MSDGRNRLIAAPGGAWSLREGHGYVIHVDHRGEEPVAFAESVARGLDDHPRWLDCRYLYDEAGSRIYEKITEQPEYYLTRTEASILARQANRIRDKVGDVAVVELGSGSSLKTRHILDAWTSRLESRYVPVDINISALEAACRSLAAHYPLLAVEGVAASYERGLSLVSSLSPLMLVFLGSTVGNLNNVELDAFLETVSACLTHGDHFLLGVDLVKAPTILEAAYNDEAGWTARFTRNLFEHMNRRLGTDIPLEAIEHVAVYNDRMERIEIYARFTRQVDLELGLIQRHFRIAAGEMVLIEISRKFHAPEVAANAARFGFLLEEVLTDPAELFGLLVLSRARATPVADNRRRMLETQLARLRARTYELIGPLQEDEQDGRHLECRKRVLFELGQTCKFEERWVGQVSKRSSWLEQSSPPQAGFFCPSCAGAETIGEAGGRTDWNHQVEELERVRRVTTRKLREVPLDPTRPLTAAGHVYQMVIRHEAHHQERILQAIATDEDLVYEAPFDGSLPPRPDRVLAGEQVLVPAGSFWMGSDDTSLAFDYERPRHRVELAAYWIDTAPVTNGRFLAFVMAGGYQDQALWSEDGWKWKLRVGAEAPLHWQAHGGQWRVRIFGRWRSMDPVRPVMHLSYFEAEAYCRRAGKRLPSEAEWEKAAAWDPARRRAHRYPWGEGRPTGNLATLDQRLSEPAPVGSYPRGRSFYGCHQMVGDVWEWTSSPFLPYPGFEDFLRRGGPGAAFGTEPRVLRGGSWATPAVAIRNTRRSWALPHSVRLFAGFRCAADA